MHDIFTGRWTERRIGSNPREVARLLSILPSLVWTLSPLCVKPNSAQRSESGNAVRVFRDGCRDAALLWERDIGRAFWFVVKFEVKFEGCGQGPKGAPLSAFPILHEATGDDAREIASIVRRAFRKQAQTLGIRGSEHPAYAGFETAVRVRSRLADGARIVVARVDDRAVGTVTWRLDSGSPAKGEITRLAVLPSVRGGGIGRALMESAESALFQTGAAVAEVSVVATFDRLRAYYETMGYISTRRCRFNHLPFDVLFMEKQCPRRDATDHHLILD